MTIRFPIWRKQSVSLHRCLCFALVFLVTAGGMAGRTPRSSVSVTKKSGRHDDSLSDLEETERFAAPVSLLCASLPRYRGWDGWSNTEIFGVGNKKKRSP